MLRGEIIEMAELSEPVSFIEGRRLEIKGIEPDSDAASFKCSIFRHFHQA